MLKILNIDPDQYSPQAHDLLATIGEVDCVRLSGKPLIDVIAPYDILVMRFAEPINKEILDAATHLKVIACNVTGTDHIDVACAQQKNIQIISLKGEVDFLNTIHATAELSWGLLLSLLRKIPEAHHQASQGIWNRDQFLSHELYGKHLGILGYGRIGKKVARYAQAFGMTVSAYDIDSQQYDDQVIGCNNLEELLAKLDLLSIHLPLNERTKNSINAHTLGKIKKGAYIINTARGDIVNEQDLISALDSQQISAYGADVISGEYDPITLMNNPLIKYANTHNNLLLTPHIGGVTQESWGKTEVFIAQKLVRFLSSFSFSADSIR